MKAFYSNLRDKFEQRPDLWFFVFANLIFIAMYAWSLAITPQLLKPLNCFIFTLLTFIHIGLHWSLLKIGESDKWFWPYVIFQGILAMAVIQLSQNIGMIFALYMALIGEAIGSGRRRLRAFSAVLYYSLLSLGNYIYMVGAEYSLWWVAGTLPMVIFVTLYVILYTRESEAREQTQNLLEELEVAHKRLSEYADQVEQLTLSTERQRMARELHDTLAQGLAGLILQLEAADSHISAERSKKLRISSSRPWDALAPPWQMPAGLLVISVKEDPPRGI